MPRIVRDVDDILVIPSGQLPTSGYWFSGEGKVSDSRTDGGGLDAGGINLSGNHSDALILHLRVEAWASVTALELIAQISRQEAADTTEWGPLEVQIPAADHF